jgi:6-phosphofructokinase 1
VQQGGTPSPMDRVRAVRFGIKALQHLEAQFGQSREEIMSNPLSSAIIGVRGSRVKFSPMERIENEETDWKDRRPKNEYWINLIDTVDTLSGRKSRKNVGSPDIAPNGKTEMR